MRMNRWKLVAGVVGLSVCGLAAMAEPACRTVGLLPGRSDPTPDAAPKPDAPAKPEAGGKPAAPPDLTPPKPAEVVPLPTLPTPPAVTEAGFKEFVKTIEKAEPTSPLLPTVVVTDPAKVPAEPPLKLEVKAEPPAPKTPAAPPVQVLDLPVVVTVENVKPTPAPLAMPPLPAAHAQPLPQPTTPPVIVDRLVIVPDVKTPPLPTPAPVAPEVTLPKATPAQPVVPVAAVTTATAPATVEKKLKVMLHMGEGCPKFEVCDGDEIVLKVVSESIDVKAPSEKGESVSVMRAAGGVRFVTPGGDGLCDELRVVPGTGEVTATGKVSFKYNWGKVETAVSSDKMTFRLGTTPGAADAKK